MVDDEPAIVGLLTTVLSENGWDVTPASSGADGIEKLERGHFDVILTDLMMPGENGIDLLRASKEFRPDVEVILMTGFATADTAVEAMRNGAFHYLVKPLKMEEVLNLAREGLHAAAAPAGEPVPEVRGPRRVPDPVRRRGQRSDRAGRLLRAGHRARRRSRAPGRGARVRPQLLRPVHPLLQPPFRGAVRARPLRRHDGGKDHRGPLRVRSGGRRPPALYRSGKIEMANHGTLFVSDLEEAGREALERLANFLDAKKLPPAEEGKEVTLNIRFIASSSLPLDELKIRGTVSPRLAAMLEPGAVRVPPLRERREDVPLLLHHFLEEANQERKKPLKGFTPAALSILEPYDWPGNVRELAHLVRGISAKKKQGTMIDASDIPPEIVYRQLRKKEPHEQEP